MIENIDHGWLHGWVAGTPTSLAAPRLHVWARRYSWRATPEQIGSLTATISHPDANAPVGSDRRKFGFSFPVPQRLRDGAIYYLSVTVSAGHREINLLGPRTVVAFGDGAEISGQEQMVFDHSISACEEADIPDAAAHAFRDSDDNIQMLAAHYVTYRLVGKDFDHLKKDCSQPVMRSEGNPDPSQYSDFQWLIAPYTRDGRTIYALVHDEYHPWEHHMTVNGNSASCDVPQAETLSKCWYNAVTWAFSINSGRSYVEPDVPGRLIATVPVRYESRMGKTGIFSPTNIVLNSKDGFYYALAYKTIRNGRPGVCVIRTDKLDDPRSWRAWDGRAFHLKFYDPYIESVKATNSQICATVFDYGIPHSLTFNTFFSKWLVVINGNCDVNEGHEECFSYSLSTDLIHWSAARLIMTTPKTDAKAQRGELLAYPSLINHGDRSRNFERSGTDSYLYFTRWNRSTLWSRCLVRVPIHFFDRTTINGH